MNVSHGSRYALFGALLVLPVIGCASASMGRLFSPPPDQPAGAELPADRAATVCLTAAREMENKGFVPDAIDQYEKARRYDARVASQASPRLALLYERQGNMDRASSEYQRALQLGPVDAPLLNDFGYFLYGRGQLAEAEKQFRRALAKDPSYGRAWVNLGMVLAHLGREQESLEAFGRVLSPAQAQANLGMLLAKQGKTEQARAALERALQLDANLRQANAFLAALDRQGDPSLIARSPPPPVER
jgi:Tfp pilus assembly protein PilF